MYTTNQHPRDIPGTSRDSKNPKATTKRTPVDPRGTWDLLETPGKSPGDPPGNPQGRPGDARRPPQIPQGHPGNDSRIPLVFCY